MIYQHQLSTLVLDHLHDIYMCLRRAFAPVYLSSLSPVNAMDMCYSALCRVLSCGRVVGLVCHCVFVLFA
jgi:hypothetical protein